MPRQARPHTPGSPHHLIARFVNHEFRFLTDRDRREFLRCLARARRRTQVRVCAFALMSSHVHIAAVGDESPLGSFLHCLDTAFARWWNDEHGGYGPVFAERPSSGVIRDTDGLARLVAYIHNNPCRAGLVFDPSASDWTSHRAMVGLARCPIFLDDEWTLETMGFSATPEGRMDFHEYVQSRSGLPRDPHFSPRAPTDEEVRAFIASTSRIWDIDAAQLARPSKSFERDARLVLIDTAIGELGARGYQVADELGLARSVLSRLRKKARGMADPNLIDGYLFDNAGKNGSNSEESGS